MPSSNVDEERPRPNKFAVACKSLGKFVGKFLGKYFGGYLLEEAGGSLWVPTGVLLGFRLLCGAAFIGVMGMAIRRQLWAATVAPLGGVLLSAMLSTASFLYMRRISNVKLALIAGPLYQTSASIAIFLLPLFIFLHVINPDTVRGVMTAANVLPAAVFLADALLFGARIRFRLPLMALPILLEWIAVFAPLGAHGWFKSSPDGTSPTSRKPVLLVVAITLAWSIASALIAVIVTRVAGCWVDKQAKKEEEEAQAEAAEDWDDEEEDVAGNEEGDKREGDSPV